MSFPKCARCGQEHSPYSACPDLSKQVSPQRKEYLRTYMRTYMQKRRLVGKVSASVDV